MRLLLILALGVVSAVGSLAQNQSASDPLTPQPPDNCEGNSARLDVVRNKSAAAGENKIAVAISRLGNGEQSRELNRRRLYTIRSYLTAMGLSSQKLVTAEGERVTGYGRIELYIGGELVEVLPVERCKDLRVGICDNDREDRRRYQLPLRRNGSQCR
jgi:hypothetical protein